LNFKRKHFRDETGSGLRFRNGVAIESTYRRTQ